MEILYISTCCSNKLKKYIWDTSTIKPVQSGQKFHGLLIAGLATYSNKLHAITSVPVIVSSHKRLWWNLPSEHINGIDYNYLPFINLPIIKNAMIFIMSLFHTIRWILIHNKKQKFVICDPLNLSLTGGALLACKFMRQKVAVIVTDLPNLMINQKKLSIKGWLYRKLVTSVLFKFDKYILLTEQMNKVVNPNNNPSIVMEGIVDLNMQTSTNLICNKASEKILIYAGGIYEKYGIKNLILAFLKLTDINLRLHIYGAGEMEEDMPEFIKLDSRIKYLGSVENEKVVANLSKATLLINPRPTTEIFTQFSFPSKNMEYMVSGTPLVTTKLPGMPIEYNQFVYLFDDESETGIFNTLQFLLDKPKLELHNFGLTAKEIVLNKKSNFIQAGRIIDFLK